MTTKITPWFVAKAKGRDGGPTFTLQAYVGRTNEDGSPASAEITTPAIPSPALVEEVNRKGRAEAWLSPDGGQWRLASLDRDPRWAGYFADMAAADDAGETITVIAIWKN